MRKRMGGEEDIGIMKRIRAVTVAAILAAILIGCGTPEDHRPFIKVLRRVFYRPKKILGNRKLLNRLSAQEIAI